MIVPGSGFMVGGKSDPYWDNVILLMHFNNNWTDYSPQNHSPSNSGATFASGGKFDACGAAKTGWVAGYITYTFGGNAAVSVTAQNGSPLSGVGGDELDFSVTISGLVENVSGTTIRTISGLNATFKTLNFEADLSEDVYVFSNNQNDSYFILGFGNATVNDLLRILIPETFDYNLSSDASYSNTHPYVGLPFPEDDDNVSKWITKEIKYDGGGRIKVENLTSASFDAKIQSGGYVTIPGSTFEMTSPDNTATAFTVEFWVYVNTPTDTSSIPLIAARRGADDINVWYIDLSWGKLRYFADTSGGAIGDTLADDLPSATWTHVAWSRSPSSAGNFNKIFVNGVEKYSTGGGTWWFDNVTLLEIFRRRDGISNLVAAKGGVDDLRITRGVARYTANFTPPTAPFPNS